VLLFVATNQLGDLGLVRELLAGSGGADASTEAAAAVEDGYATAIAVGFGLSLLGWFNASRLRRFLTDARMAKRGPDARVEPG
jgi:hypothetical protein